MCFINPPEGGKETKHRYVEYQYKFKLDKLLMVMKEEEDLLAVEIALMNQFKHSKNTLTRPKRD